MVIAYHKSMKKRIVICFFMLFLLNFSLEFSITCNSQPESQDDTRPWTLLNNENNSVIVEAQDSRFVSIHYYIEEIEEIDQMRYVVNMNFTGDNVIIYGNVSWRYGKNLHTFLGIYFCGRRNRFLL